MLRDKLVAAAGTGSWEAGYVEAVFTSGGPLILLFQPRFGPLWKQVGTPPGPWPAAAAQVKDWARIPGRSAGWSG
ncbi:MAG TPA: hypothetical protein VNG12_13035 [Acidimicrobiales bacterium]|nr:hypothetical protein [Acidimicrobiales bacterium]